MNEVREELYSTFSLNENQHELYFHSGATEGIGTVIRGFFEKNPHGSFVYSASDHSCVYQHAQRLKKLGTQVIELPVDHNGQLAHDVCDQLSSLSRPILLNWTWVNNETGVVFPLEQALAFKQQLGECYVHVDAVQAPGKIARWQQVNDQLDGYTFSSHKFGALKGVGFTFVRRDFDFEPIILGGGQQAGHRSGTENTYGAYSSMLALQELRQKYNADQAQAALVIARDLILSGLGDGGELVAATAPHRNTNTLYIVFKSAKSDITSVAFDLAGMDVSTGSACSSGAILPSRVLLRMGYDEVQAKSAIRFSFSPFMTSAQAQVYGEKISSVVNRFA